MSELWQLDASGVRRLAGVAGILRCVEGAPGQSTMTASAACTSMGTHGRTTVLAVGARGRVTTLGSVSEPVTVLAAGPDGHVAAILPMKRQLLLFDATGRRSSIVPLPEAMTYATELRWVAGGIAVLGSNPEGNAMQLV